MKQITFTENELDLIAACVLQTIRDLRAANERLFVADATQSIGTTIHRCNNLLRTITEKQENCHEK